MPSIETKQAVFDSTGLPLVSGPYAGLFCITANHRQPFVNFALATNKEDAAHIVTACNQHAALLARNAELVEALRYAEKILSATECSGEKQLGNGAALDQARAALAKAKEAL